MTAATKQCDATPDKCDRKNTATTNTLRKSVYALTVSMYGDATQRVIINKMQNNYQIQLKIGG